MHLGNGIICPVTGIPMLMLAGITAYYAFKKAKTDFNKEKILYTITLTILVFTLQMINFSIPHTGSSGHIIGAMLLSVLIGPYAGFIAMCSIILVQGIFFADGSLLALGCNIINMGAFASFAAYPLIYKPFSKNNKEFIGAILSSILALQLGAFAVVTEGVLSGSIALNSIANFTCLMQIIHLPIGIIEGLITGIVILAVKKTNYKKASISFGLLSLIFASFIFKFASTKPDGLEWSLLKIEDSIIPQIQSQIFIISETLQNKTAILTNIEPLYSNLLGIFILGFIMYLLCFFMYKQKAEN
ncbi:TPA: energy-coupling factor ABC transporter permease [Candidatus Avigastranaerophilus faecigallinarum]|nr:energy-coupling factor ABC transporter permease [Candidatus Avigastranaerophilus faecigallinarum]